MAKTLFFHILTAFAILLAGSGGPAKPVYLPVMLTPGSAAARSWPDTTAAILPFDDQPDTSAMTEAQWAFLATHYAGTQKVTAASAAHLRQFNANFLVLHYRLGQTLGYRMPDGACNPAGGFLQIIHGDSWVQEWPGDGAVQETWFYHVNGSRVFDCAYGHYLMDLSNPGWRAWWSAQVIQQLADNQDDGLFADSYSVPNYGFTWKPALPEVDPAFEADWAAREHAFSDYMEAAFAGRWKWIPNIGAWITTRDPSDYSNLDGAMVEGFAEWGGGNYFDPGDWKLQLTRLLPLSAAGKILIGQTYPDPNDVQERMFILGTYLLLKGSRTYINLETTSQVAWFPEYGIDLGAPVGPLPATVDGFYNSGWGVYARQYSKGLVLVNPGDTPVTIALGHAYTQVTPSGGGPVSAGGTPTGSLVKTGISQLQLEGHQAAVLENSK